MSNYTRKERAKVVALETERRILATTVAILQAQLDDQVKYLEAYVAGVPYPPVETLPEPEENIKWVENVRFKRS